MKFLVPGWRPYAWLALLAFVLYLKTLGYGLSYMDDDTLVLGNHGLLADWGNLGRAFLTDMSWNPSGQYYRPLVTVSLMLDAAWAGLRIWGYRLTNLAIHAINAGLVFRLLASLGHGRGPSFFAAALFTVHPALAHAVAYLPGRYDMLTAAFSLSAFLSACRYLRNGGAVNYAAVILAVSAALLCKETALALPAVLLWYGIFVEKRDRRAIALGAGTATAFAGYLLLRRSALGAPSYSWNTIPENLAGLIGYIGKTVFPLKLSNMPVPGDIPLIPGLAALTAATVLFASGGLTRKRVFYFGLGWFLLFLAPTAARAMGFTSFLEQRLYLPMVGLAVAAGQSAALAGWRRRRWAPLAAAGLVAVFAARTFFHLPAFADDLSFWSNAARTSPGSYFAQAMLAQRLASRGLYDDAVRRMEKSVALKPDDPALLNDLGVMLTDAGRLDEAEARLLASARIDPDDAAVHRNLGSVYLKLRSLEMAGAHLGRSLELDPEDPRANHKMALVCYLEGRYEQALEYYNRAVLHGLDPDPRIDSILAPHRPPLR